MDAIGKTIVYVVVVTFNGMKFYDRCFSSLINAKRYNSTSIPGLDKEVDIRIIAVDNASIGNDTEYIKAKFPEVEVIQSSTNLGFGKANNIGLKLVLERDDADYVFLLNQDAWLTKQDTIYNLVHVAEKNKEFGILSPMHLNSTQTKIEQNLILYLDNSSITDKTFFEDLYFNRVRDCYESNYINAAAWLIPVDVLKIVGGFDPLYIHYGEDDNYLQRLFFHGYKLGICPVARIVHATEDRIQGHKGIHTQFSKLLDQILDINRPTRYFIIFLSLCKKNLRSIMLLDFKQTGVYINQLLFFLKHIKSFKLSRSENKKKQPSWLMHGTNK